MIGLGLLLIAVIALAVALYPRGSELVLPEPVEQIYPLPGDAIIPQDGIEIDMKVGYRIVVRVDGVRLPEDQVRFLEPVGLYTWAPGPGLAFETWTPGPHEVRIEWSRVVGLPDQGEFSWTFRVQ